MPYRARFELYDGYGKLIAASPRLDAIVAAARLLGKVQNGRVIGLLIRGPA